MTTRESKTKTAESHRRVVGSSVIARKSERHDGANSLRQRLGNHGAGQLMNGASHSSKLSRASGVQAKLTISQPGDAYEREADRVADAVMRVSESRADEGLKVSRSAQASEVQRRCAGCDEEEKKLPVSVQRKAPANNDVTVPSSLAPTIYGLRGRGSALTATARAFFEPRFGVDFSGVRVHTGTQAHAAAESINAKAFTVGRDIAFASGQYAPASSEGQRLLAHELTHVVQQGGDRVQRTKLFRVPRVGTRFGHPAGSRSPHAALTAEFDGRTFTLTGSGRTLLSTAAQSGRPVSVRAADATRCGGATSDCYTNDPRYVGITDYGPIPEGVYRFRATDFATFSAAEQLLFTPGGSFEDPFGRPMHGGDWGAGRAPLNPVRITPGPRGCGNTRRRSAFFLHGGSLSGSSGCIDVGNAGIAGILPHLAGYRGNIDVTVRYRHPAPGCGTLQRVIGGATYPGQRDPSLTDRLRGAWRELTGEGAGGDEN